MIRGSYCRSEFLAASSLSAHPNSCDFSSSTALRASATCFVCHARACSAPCVYPCVYMCLHVRSSFICSRACACYLFVRMLPLLCTQILPMSVNVHVFVCTFHDSYTLVLADTSHVSKSASSTSTLFISFSCIHIHTRNTP
jgi:hypothetical protein